MYAPLFAAVKPTRVLFLSRGESSVRMDVKALRAIGMKTCSHLADVETAIAFLRKEDESRKSENVPSPKRSTDNAVDLVVCDENLRDGPALVFLCALAREQAMCSKPILLLAGTAASAKDLRDAGLHVLERPYSLSDLESMTQKAMSPMRPPLRSEMFENAAKYSRAMRQGKKNGPPAGIAEKNRPLTITDWYNKGVAHLKASELSDAERAFVRVLDGQEDHPEAALGLARLHQATGNEKQLHRYLLKAAVSCLRQGDDARAKIIADRLPERMGKNIYSGEAVACLEEGRSKAAAIAFLDAVREGGDKPLHQLVARACLQTSQPDESMAKICDAFEKMGHVVTAANLRERLLRYAPFAEEEPGAWLDRFPRLKEIVNIASYTVWAWKQVRV